MPYTIICNQCLREIQEGEMPVLDNGLYFHQSCFVLHKKGGERVETPKARILVFADPLCLLQCRLRARSSADYG